MSATVPLTGRIDTLNQLVNLVLKNNAKMHLLGTPLTVSDSTTLANCHAHEATFLGYSAATLCCWTAATDTSAPNSISTATATFNPVVGSPSYAVYGYYLTDSTSTKFYGVEVFSSGPITLTPGTPYEPTLEYDLFSAF